MPKTLYIIGNGFDLYHGVPSRYSDFGAYLEERDRETFRTVENYFPDEELWSDLESAFASLDTQSLIDDAGVFMTGYGSDDWSDAANHDFQYEVDRVAAAMSRTLRAHFSDWVRQLEIPSPGSIADKLLRLDPDGYFLNFNYTPTLERLYGIAPHKILYIHGAASRPTDEIVLGHGWRRNDADSLNYRIDRESADFRLIEGNRIIDRYFAETFKPVEDIIARNAPAWAAYRNTTDIFVLGHSLAAVDHPYFAEVCKARSQRPQWHISYFGSVGDRPGQMAALGVPGTSITYFELPALARVQQGQLF